RHTCRRAVARGQGGDQAGVNREADRRRQAWAKAGLFASPGLAAGELLGADEVGIARVQRQRVQLGCLAPVAEMGLADCRCRWSRDLLGAARRRCNGWPDRSGFADIADVAVLAGWARAMIWP